MILNNKKLRYELFKVHKLTFVGVSAYTLGAAFINAFYLESIDTKIADVQIGDIASFVIFEQCKGSKKVRIMQVLGRVFT